MTTRHYIGVRFAPWDRRTYTYHHDGGPITVGSTVEVATKDGPKHVPVVGCTDSRPTFATKPITRIVEMAPEPLNGTGRPDMEDGA